MVKNIQQKCLCRNETFKAVEPPSLAKKYKNTKTIKSFDKAVPYLLKFICLWVSNLEIKDGQKFLAKIKLS